MLNRPHTSVPKKRTLSGVAGIVLAAALVAGCQTIPDGITWLVPDFSRLAKTYGPAVVHISVTRDAKQVAARRTPRAQAEDGSLGSGFIVSEDGYILTNAHVVAQGTQILVRMADRKEFKARLIGMDQIADVALLKIDATQLPTVKIGNPSRVEVGEWAFAIGSPYGFQHSASVGIISAKNRILPGADYVPFLQTDVPVNPGNSGGPLFNLRGEVIGINSRIYSNSGGYQGLSFAIPVDTAMRIKEQLQRKGQVTRSRVGISVQEVSQGLADSFYLPKPAGALVGYVEPNAAADRSGVKSGDVILSVNGREVVQSADALIYIADSLPGEKATLVIWRDKKSLSLEITPDRFDAPVLARNVTEDTAAPSLGMRVRSLLPREQDVLRISGGLFVESANAAIQRAGVRVGDIILAVNGEPVSTLLELANEVRVAEHAVALLIQRNGARLFVPIEMPKGPVSAEQTGNG
jgi:serine protease Do